MADVKVPLKFQIFRGDELVREEVLNQDVIKVGKLASSHLRIDDETVSRMHAVIEIAGPDGVSLIDLGSTRGTTVNGERITKTRLQSGDEIMFGDARVVVTFLQAAETTPVPAAAYGQPRPGPVARAGAQASRLRRLLLTRSLRGNRRMPLPLTLLRRLPVPRDSVAATPPPPRWRPPTVPALSRCRRSSAAWSPTPACCPTRKARRATGPAP